MELVDVPDSKSGAARRGGSSPPRGTTDGSFHVIREPKTINQEVKASLKLALNDLQFAE